MAKRLPAGIRQRSDGRFESRFTVGGKRYSAVARTVKECKQKELGMRQEIEAGAYTKNKNLVLDRYFEEWMSAREGSVKGATQALVKGRYKNHISPVLGKRRISDIEKREIVRLQQTLAEKMKPISVNSVITLLKGILKDAVNDGIIVKNPAAGIKTLRESGETAAETIHRALTLEEQEAFAQEARQEWLYEMLMLLLCTGLRQGEAAALKWSDIDYVNGVIHITKTITKTSDGKYAVGETKSKAGTRDIPLTDVSKGILKSQKEKQKLIHGNMVALSGNVFEGARGGMVHDRCIIYAIESTLRRLEEKGTHIERFTSHALRDTFATRYIENGGSLQTLKTILGHTSLKMTADLYAHVLPNTKKEEMDKVSTAFGAVTG